MKKVNNKSHMPFNTDTLFLLSCGLTTTETQTVKLYGSSRKTTPLRPVPKVLLVCRAELNLRIKLD